MRVLTYCLMLNHFHLVVWFRRGRDRALSEFMRWLQVTHTQRWHAHYRGEVVMQAGFRAPLPRLSRHCLDWTHDLQHLAAASWAISGRRSRGFWGGVL